MKSFNFFIELLIKASIILILILAAFMEHEYSYYTFLRWCVTFSSIYFIYKAYTEKEVGLIIIFTAIALLFNPFHKFIFQRETWRLIDIIISTILLLTIIYEWKISKK